MEYLEFRAMNSDIVLAAEGDEHALGEGFKRARAFIHASEARFTRFYETSELAALNRSAGEWLVVSSGLYQLVHSASEYVDETGGLFDPSILDALEHAGYDKSIDEIRRTGASAQGKPGEMPRADVHAIEFNPDLRGIKLPRGLRLDLGGIAKGWIAERAAHILAEFSTASAVSAGGDMYMTGLPQNEPCWEVALEDPRDASRVLTVLRLGPGAVATSSITKRRWQQGSQVMHHLIDPRTGQPANTDWLSVTVIAPHTSEAEVFAKALLIAGSREVVPIAPRRPDLAFIAVDANGQLHVSNISKELKDAEIHYA